MVKAWDRVRELKPEHSHLMLAYARADVAPLNKLARERLAERGELGPSQTVQTERGVREFATGDRLLFLRNERSIGVRNGSLGTIGSIAGGQMGVRLDDGRDVAFALRDYADLDHGYATTIHKPQGSTVDHTHVLASRHMDRHATYVALSRHRRGTMMRYGADEFASPAGLGRSLARERAKDSSLDFPDAPLPSGLSRDRGFPEKSAVNEIGRVHTRTCPRK
jgi:hypothetical protein